MAACASQGPWTFGTDQCLGPVRASGHVNMLAQHAVGGLHSGANTLAEIPAHALAPIDSTNCILGAFAYCSSNVQLSPLGRVIITFTTLQIIVKCVKCVSSVAFSKASSKANFAKYYILKAWARMLGGQWIKFS